MQFTATIKLAGIVCLCITFFYLTGGQTGGRTAVGAGIGHGSTAKQPLPPLAMDLITVLNTLLMTMNVPTEQGLLFAGLTPDQKRQFTDATVKIEQSVKTLSNATAKAEFLKIIGIIKNALENIKAAADISLLIKQVQEPNASKTVLAERMKKLENATKDACELFKKDAATVASWIETLKKELDTTPQGQQLQTIFSMLLNDLYTFITKGAPAQCALIQQLLKTAGSK